MNDAQLGDFVLPTRLRNPNFIRAGGEWLFVTLVLCVPLVFAPLDDKWFFALLTIVAAAPSLYYFLAARRVDLIVSDEGLALGGLIRSRSFVWSEVARFEIREPSRRTPFMLAFAPWRDQAKATLIDGSPVRIRAIEPWHGFTAITYFAIQRYTQADRTVDALNELLASRTTNK